MIKRSFHTIIIILSLGLLLVSCKSDNTSSNDVSLDFLITPEKIIVHSDDQLMELNKVEDKANASIKLLNEKYDDLSKLSGEDIKQQEKIQNEVLEVLNSGKIIEENVKIENIFKQLRDLKGEYIDSFEEDIIAKIYLVESPETSAVVSLDNTYLRMLLLLKDASIVIPKAKISDSSTELHISGEIEYIKVKLTDKLKKELEELAKF